jgi:hypothetical protein
MIAKKAQEIIEKFHNFTNGYRVSMLINRGMANTNKGSRRWVSKLISSDPISLEKNIIQLLEHQHYINNPDVRLYMCVNERNIERAITYFKHKQLDLKSVAEIDKFYRNIHDSFCSALMNPECRKHSLFLIDWDNEKEPPPSFSRVYELFRYKTPNGWHIITAPFNPELVEKFPEIEIKRDALLLLHTLNS